MPAAAWLSTARLESPLDVLAQRVEFALQAGGHLVAQFLAQAAQFAGDLADHGDAVFLAAHAVDVAGDCLVILVESRRGLHRAFRPRRGLRILIPALLAGRRAGRWR